MYFKAFGYGHDEEEVLEFVKWWIASTNFLNDFKKGDNVRGMISIRDIDHTIQISSINDLTLVIKKGIISSDDPSRELKNGEMYLNKKSLFGKTGFDKAIETIKKWIKKKKNIDPYSIDREKALILEKGFDMIGVGFYLKSDQGVGWFLEISVEVVGIPK